MQFWKTLPAVLAAGMVMSLPTTAQARPSGEIIGPVLKQHSSITKMRKTLRGRVKKGQPLTGAEYYALAFSCGYEEPKGPSKIMNFLSQSKCTDQIAEYYVQAGMHGTPDGFLAAARKIATGQDAWTYGQLAYILSGTDVALRDEALTFLSDLRPSSGTAGLSDTQAATLAQKLVASRIYGSAIPAAGTKQFAIAPKRLDWLDFAKPSECEWSKSAYDVFNGIVRWDSRTEKPLPAKVRVPGFSKPIQTMVSYPRTGQGEPDYVVTEVHFSGMWHGLKVYGLENSFYLRSDAVSGETLLFSDPPGKVIPVLRKLGFPVRADGKAYSRLLPANPAKGIYDALRVTTSVTKVGQLTAFACGAITDGL